MKYSSGLRLLCGGWALASLPAAGALPDTTVAFLDKLCFECHDGLSAKGDLDLSAADFDPGDPANFDLWAIVFDRVEGGEMPPEGEARPEAGERRGFLAAVSGHLASVEREQRLAIRQQALWAFFASARKRHLFVFLSTRATPPEDEVMRMNRPSQGLQSSVDRNLAWNGSGMDGESAARHDHFSPRDRPDR